MMSPSDSATHLFVEESSGNQHELDGLMQVLYDELYIMACGYLRRERPDHTLQATALLNETYLRLIDQTRLCWQNHAHFLAIAARSMREILIDHARSHNAAKRGGGTLRLPLSKAVAFFEQRDVDLLLLDDALDELEAIDSQKARIVEFRFFVGFSIEETAEAMGISTPTVIRQWRLAKAWLYRRIKKGAASDG